MIRIVAVVLLLAGCTGSVAELDDLQELYAQGDYAAVAARPLECTLGEEGCARSHEMKADSCLRLAQQAVREARAAEAAEPADCAAHNYRALLAADLGDATALGARELEAVRLERESAPDFAAGGTFNDALARRASDFGAREPSLAEGPYYAASALFWRASFEDVTDDCAVLRDARDLAARAAESPSAEGGPPGGVGEAARALARRATEAARSRGCAGV